MRFNIFEKVLKTAVLAVTILLPAASAAQTGYTPAAMVTPANGSILAGSSQLFTWSSASAPSYYVLYVGTSPGATNIYYNGYLTGTSVTASGLPTNGSTIYVRLWSNNGQWYFQDYSYTSGPGSYTPAAMLTPANGSALTGSSQLFTWSSASATSYYVLYVGTAPGTSNIYYNGYITGTSVTATGLPTTTSTIYVRLWSNNGQWYFQDYSYTTGSIPYTPAAMLTPVNGSTLAGSSQLFTWSSASAPSYYVLYVGTAPGTANIYYNGYIAGTSVTATGLPTNGSTIYVRLWSNNGQWYFQDYSYTTGLPVYTPAAMVSPANGSTLAGTSQLFTWSSASAPSYYVLYVGTAPGTANIYYNGYVTGTSITATGLPTNGSTIYVRLWSNNGQWYFQDYSYTTGPIVYIPAAIISPPNGSALTGTSQLFTWSSASAPSYYVLYVGTAPGTANIYYNGYITGTSVTATGLPGNGSTIYVRLWSNNGQWYYRDYTYLALSPPAVPLTVQRTSTLLPDGNTVQMWGYTCGTVTIPGVTCVPLKTGVTGWSPPLITVPVGTNLSIALTNNLPVPTSIMIVGQLGGGLGGPVKVASPAHSQTQTTWPTNSPATFTPPTQPQRARSLVPEVAAGASNRSTPYAWNSLKPGTYLIETGTRPSIQGPMGLYGVLVVTAAPTATAAGTAYTGFSYDADATMLLSEIDPVQNAAVDSVAARLIATTPAPTAGQIESTETAPWNPTCSAAHTCYPPAVEYSPRYFLINGQSFDITAPAKSTLMLPTASFSGNVLVRFVNASPRMHVPTLVGLPMWLIAEDGNVLPEIQVALAAGRVALPKLQNEVFLAAGKVYDVAIRPPASAGTYVNATYPVFDRQLSLTANNQPGGGMQAYLQIGSGGIMPAFGGTQGGTGFAAPAVLATKVVNDTYTLAPNATTFSANVLGNDSGVTSATIGSVNPSHGTVVLNSNGSFTYTPTGAYIVADTFTYLGNGTLTGTVTITVPAAVAAPVAVADTFTSNVATLIKVARPGVLANDTSSSNYPLAAVLNSAGNCGTVTLNSNGSFMASAPTANPCAFTYHAVNSQGTSSNSTTATLTFLSGSGLAVTVHDAQTPATTITDYRWVIEEDKTLHTPTGVSSRTLPILSTSFHRSSMPMVAQGCVGPISCGTGQTILGVAAALQPQSTPGQVNLPAQDPVTGAPKYYYLSVLPGDAANPVVNGANGHTLGGALIAPVCNGTITPGTTTCSVPYVIPSTLAVLVEPNPLPVAQLNVFLFEDNSPTNGDVDEIEQNQGLGDFEIILADVAGATGDPTGQMTYDMFNMPLINSLIGQPGCPDIHNPGTAAPDGIGGNLVGVIYTCPNGSGTHTIQSISPSGGVAGTIVTVTTTGANNFFYTGELVTIAGVGTGYNGTFSIVVTGPGTFTYTSTAALAANPTQGGTATDSAQYALAGHALIKNLFPNRFDVFANPGAARVAAGETWIQTSTLEGTRAQDAFAKAGEPPYFQEFGPPGFHAFIGFINPAHINATNAALQGTNTITGTVTMQHMSRPSSEIIYDSGSRATLAHTTCYAGLNSSNGTGDNIAFAKCDQNGNFTLTGVPVGTHQVVVWDQWLDQIISYTTVTVPPPVAPATSTTVAMGNIPVFSWFTHVKASIYTDLNKNGVRDPGEPGISQIPVRIRFRDGSISNTLLTDPDGNAYFHELFPLFNWFVVESDDTRFKGSGVRIAVDGGGAVDSTGTYAGILSSNYPPYNNAGVGTGGSTIRTDPAGTDTEGLQGFISQTAFLDWGKTPYVVGENGGIRGTVVYASTRPFDDPNIGIQNVWAPLVPNVTINLYQEITSPDGTLILTKVDTTQTSSWDDWVNRTGRYSGLPPMSCPGQNPLDPFVPYTLGAANLTKCYDGFHNWNQVQPAVYDGLYKFPSPAYIAGHALTAPQIAAGQTLVSLPPGKYVTEVVVPPGYEIVKEEDKNILIGDTFIGPVAQQFGALADIFILPDQASINSYNAYNPNNSTTNMGRSVFSEFGPGAQINLSAPCVGSVRVVPDYLSLYPQAQQVAPFAGASRNLCDRREVILEDQMQGTANFFIFTPTPIAAHFTGMVLDDASAEFNVASPDWGEKFGVPFVPVSFRNFNGIEVYRTYSDEFGMFSGVIYSTWSVNPPNPTGYAPNMMITCMNDPGPIPDPAHPGQLITDPMYNPMYSNFCYTNPFMPGRTDYMDTPVLPVAAFASGYNPPDCAYPDATPAISSVNGDGQFGPWLNPAGARTLTINALGDVAVPNNAYAGPSATAAPFNQKTITRHYGFGNATGTVDLLNSLTGAVVQTLSLVTWSDSQIVVTVPGTVAPGSYELSITAANGKKSVDTVTVTIQAAAPTYVTPPTTTGMPGPIQTAIDGANAGDLIMLGPGTYPELVIMWKPVRLQGVGAASVIINAAKYPTEKLDYWRSRINPLFGIDPSGNLTGPAFVDPLPGQVITGGTVLLEPTVLNTEEGAGITVLAKNLGTASNSPCSANVSGTTVYNFNCYPSRIDGIGITGGDSGGGVFVNGWAHNLEIANNRVYGNAGTFAGGIRIGQPLLEVPTLPSPFNGFGYDNNVKIHDNKITSNGTVEGNTGETGAGGGLSIASGTDNYVVKNNFVCGNVTLGDGGGIGHTGLSMNGNISNNQILFNQSYNLSGTSSGGGIAIEGEPSPLGGLTLGTGNVTVNANLIQGNHAQAGHGGGIRLQDVNGADVTNNPGSPNSWWHITVTNNMTVNNVAGWSGGGISLFDTVDSSIINNTVMSNDSTATVGALFTTSQTQSSYQPAGISSELNSPALCLALAGAPAAFRCTGSQAHPFSSPTLDNNIIFQNRSFYFTAGATDPNTGLTTTALIPTLTQTSVGQCPNGANYWDLGVLGQPQTGATLLLNPEYSILTNTAGYSSTNNVSNPLVVSQYCNGSRVNPGTPANPTVAPAPQFTMQPVGAEDEGGNWINVLYGPLSQVNSSIIGSCTGAGCAPPAYNVLLGNYSLTPGSPTGLGGVVNAIPCSFANPLAAAFPVLQFDFLGLSRPFPSCGANSNAYDIGAHERR